ncbi:OmpA family protein [Pseudomonas sp. ABY48]|uniref:OmpA family protein n=1 Tax=Pseudomonas sp. ABY48 TaxID=3402865 RepID=UPI003B42F625
MSALFEVHVRLGGDPRGYNEFALLRDELAKLGHLACPDVDWHKVEQLCLVLLQLNGAELQTVSFYTLARSQRHGLDGMAQGLRLLENLVGQWPSLWPASVAVRLEILGWLFAQLQALLRRLALTTRALLELDNALASLHEQLISHTTAPLLALQTLRQQISSLIQRLEQSDMSAETALLPLTASAPVFARPIVILPPPDGVTDKKRVTLWLCSAALLFVLAAGFAWHTWWLGAQRDAAIPDPVRLDSLSLFDAGSAELKPDAAAVLVKTLIDIKAQPGWLIIIAGHSDATGSAEQNLQLSHARASAVRDWMQRVGNIPVDCFAVQGFAASQPIAGNDTEAGRMANRRVDIRLVPQAGACELSTTGVGQARA